MSDFDRERVAKIVADLESVSERLGDLSFDVLRSAVASGEGKRPDIDKALGTARRAVEKAIRTLDRGNDVI